MVLFHFKNRSHIVVYRRILRIHIDRRPKMGQRLIQIPHAGKSQAEVAVQDRVARPKAQGLQVMPHSTLQVPLVIQEIPQVKVGQVAFRVELQRRLITATGAFHVPLFF